MPATLASLGAQTVGIGRIYVIGVDNGSSDGSAAIVEGWRQREGIAGCVLGEPVRSIPRALNRALRRVRDGDVVVRIDAHTTFASDYLASIGEAFERLPSNVWCVGGAPTPPQATHFAGRLLYALYTNPAGLGPADFRTARCERSVDHVYLGAWRPGVLTRLRGFDERWLANEDSELSARVIEAGGRVVRIAARCERREKRGLAGTVRQWSRYGFWRAQTLKAHPRMTRPRHLAPPLALATACVLGLTGKRSLLACGALAYATLAIAKRPSREPALVTAAAVPFFALVQSGYALGLILGTIRSPATLRGGRGFEIENRYQQHPGSFEEIS